MLGRQNISILGPEKSIVLRSKQSLDCSVHVVLKSSDSEWASVAEPHLVKVAWSKLLYEKKEKADLTPG